MRNALFATVLAVVAAAVLLDALRGPEDDAAPLGPVAGATPELSAGLYRGTAVLVTPNGTYLATLLYAHGPAASQGLQDALRFVNDSTWVPEGVPPELREQVCAQYNCSATQATAGAEIHHELREALDTFADELGLDTTGAASADVSLAEDATFVLQIVKATAGVPSDRRDLLDARPGTEAALAEAVAVASALCERALENATTPAGPAEQVCPEQATRRVMLVNWNASHALFDDLERPEAMAVLGPLSWRTLDEAAGVSAPSIFVPMSALVAVVVGVGAGLVVNPIARRFGWDPFLPTPVIGLAVGLLLLAWISDGRHLGPAWLTALVGFGLVYGAIALWYRLGGAPFFHVLSGWITLTGLLLAGHFLLRAVLDAQRAAPAALITGLYGDPGLAAGLQRDVARGLDWAWSLVILGLLVGVLGTAWGPVERWVRLRAARRGLTLRGPPSWLAGSFALHVQLRERRRKRRRAFRVPPHPWLGWLGPDRARALNLRHPAHTAEAKEWNEIRYASRYLDGRRVHRLPEALNSRRVALTEANAYPRIGPVGRAEQAARLKDDVRVVAAYVERVRAARAFREASAPAAAEPVASGAR